MIKSKILFNSIIITSERIFTILLSIFYTPIILNALGVKDYGIYVLIIGFVGMVNMLNWTLTGGTLRFIGYYIGKNELKKLKQVFITAFSIHIIYGLIFLVVIFLMGEFLIDNLLQIPAERLSISKQLIILISLMTFFDIIGVPFGAVYNAHENFMFTSIISIGQTILKLLNACLLIFVNFDKLLFFTIFLSLTSVLSFIVSNIYGYKKYNEINYNFKVVDKKQAYEIMCFNGWNVLGAMAISGSNQGNQVLLNMFFGVIKNAGYGIAMQINAAISLLYQGIITSIKPRIIKQAGANDQESMITSLKTMTKIANITVATISIPYLFYAPLILEIWLKNPPEGAVTFSRLIILSNFIILQSFGVKTIFDAIGHVKAFNIWISLILILNLPINYILFLKGYPAYTFIIVTMILEIITFFVRLKLLNKYVYIKVQVYLRDVTLKIFSPIFLSSILSWLIYNTIDDLMIGMILTFFIFFAIYPLAAYKLALDNKEKHYFKELIKPILKRIQFKIT